MIQIRYQRAQHFCVKILNLTIIFLNVDEYMTDIKLNYQVFKTKMNYFMI